MNKPADPVAQRDAPERKGTQRIDFRHGHRICIVFMDTVRRQVEDFSEAIIRKQCFQGLEGIVTANIRQRQMEVPVYAKQARAAVPSGGQTHHVRSGGQESAHQVRADKSRSAGNQNCLHVSPPMQCASGDGNLRKF